MGYRVLEVEEAREKTQGQGGREQWLCEDRRTNLFYYCV